MTTTMTASNWGTVTAGDNNSEKAYTKYKAGANKFRIVGDILPRFVYWLSTTKTDDEGKPRKITAPFDCLSFDPTPGVETFITGAPDPIKEMGIQNTNWQGELEFDKKGAPVPLKSQRQYLFPIVNRDTGVYEYATLKGDTLAGIGELMGKLADPKQRRRWADPEYVVNSPMDIDIVLVKSGAGLGTKYKVDIVETLENVLDEDAFKAMIANFEADKELLDGKKSIQEVFPRPTYAEQKEEITKFFADDSEDEAGEQKPQSDAAQEAVDELD